MKPIIATTIMLLIFLISACTTGRNAASKKQVDKQESLAVSKLTLSPEAERGKASFEKHCQTCHGLKKPSSFTENQWKNLVPKMSGMANKNAGTTIITEEDKNNILLYVSALAKKS